VGIPTTTRADRDMSAAATTATAATPSARVTIEEFERLLETQHPFAAVLGLQIEDIGHGTATVLLPRRAEHERLGGIIAGPMLMGLAELSFYAAVVGGPGTPDAVTASLTINFLRKAPPGGVRPQARVVKAGRLTAGEVWIVPEAGGDAIAQAISTWALP